MSRKDSIQRRRARLLDILCQHRELEAGVNRRTILETLLRLENDKQTRPAPPKTRTSIERPSTKKKLQDMKVSLKKMQGIRQGDLVPREKSADDFLNTIYGDPRNKTVLNQQLKNLAKEIRLHSNPPELPFVLPPPTPKVKAKPKDKKPSFVPDGSVPGWTLLKIPHAEPKPKRSGHAKK